MKKIILSFAVLATLFTSCDMNEFEAGKIPTDSSLETVLDANKFRNGFYMNLRAMTNGDWLTAPDIQADMFIGTQLNDNRNGVMSFSTFNPSSTDIEGFWTSPYSVIANCNLFLENLPKVANNPNITEQDKVDLARYESECYFTRAFCYYQLTDKYCNSYTQIDPTTKASGVPLITKFAPTSDYSKYAGRSTLAEVYDLIFADLEKAYDGLLAYEQVANVTCIPNAPYLCSYAVAALQARMALLKGDNAMALEKCKYVLSNDEYKLTDKANYIDMWLNDVGKELIFVPYGDASQASAIANTGAAFIDAKGEKADYVPSSSCLAMYDALDDIRYDAFFEARTLKVEGNDVVSPCFVKYPGNPALNGGSSKNALKNLAKPFRLSEIYLIAAEASASTDEKYSNEMLQAIRDARIFDYVPKSYTGTELVDQIRLERAKELIGEGFRISDLRRWGLGFSRKANYTGKFANVSSILVAGGASVKYEPKYYKYLYPIPVSEIDVNPQIVNEQNPGY